VAQASGLVLELKNQLKRAGVTYRELATQLELSESAIKQMFSSGNMTLARLEKICEILEMEIGDLVRLCDDTDDKLQSLSIELEQELVSDIKLLLIAYSLVNHWTFTEIIERYDISEVEGIRYLAKLDRMKLIELLPGNRVKALVSGNFHWQPNGPIEQYFREQVQNRFFSADFNADGCLRLVKNGDIPLAARQQILARLQSVGQLFDDSVREAKKLSRDQVEGTTMVLAIREWMFDAFAELER